MNKLYHFRHKIQCLKIRILIQKIKNKLLKNNNFYKD
jgi:hypothetical protein